MGDTTARFAFYLPGGGSTGQHTPDEPVDIDKINGNFQIVDTELGLPIRSRVSVASPRNGSLAKDGDEIYVYTNGAWVNALPARLLTSPTAGSLGLDGIYIRQDNPAILDNRYYTQALLNSGQLDNRYPSKTTAGSVSASMLPFKVAWGYVNIASLTFQSGTNQWVGSAAVTFSAGFTAPPYVVATAISQDSGGVTAQIGDAGATTAGGTTLFMTRRNNFATGVYWIAIGN